MARFTLPRDLYHGEGSLAELKNLKGKKAVVVVGGGSMKRFGFLQKVEDYLKEAGMEPPPTTTTAFLQFRFFSSAKDPSQ